MRDRFLRSSRERKSSAPSTAISVLRAGLAAAGKVVATFRLCASNLQLSHSPVTLERTVVGKRTHHWQSETQPLGDDNTDDGTLQLLGDDNGDHRKTQRHHLTRF
mmetsp:Transcript_8780/g.36316  ORF Transcript_8780/g.36316 Transcript_8780/m.36316 type:complete len:105 (+) Transcript_8780:1167-1481(+)